MSTNFKSRHIGPRSEQIQEMLEELGFKDLEEMSNSVIPRDILSDKISFGITEFVISSRLSNPNSSNII